MSVRFELDYKDFEKLQEKFKKIPDEVEKTINSFLHKQGVEIMTNDVLANMPISNRNKRHARQSKPLTSVNFNLGFELKPKPRFRYLVFPDKALGTSINSTAKEFMEKGLNKSTQKIINGLNEQIDQKIKEAFG
ncbi:hypothetical protein [Metabacillus halosaccharovorans]|uniref:HK97 gp10 family phage protein n=1 Tax=Metabacillus halosaccharovorans TaxID=930124 RepID=A0ABT3DGP5_9BACI|nr:hypothetical protein [Metabacillus halosaccharovorans]MCV9886240.1 hypothetical protein [Metabacillus halosaccharovorans]